MIVVSSAASSLDGNRPVAEARRLGARASAPLLDIMIPARSPRGMTAHPDQLEKLAAAIRRVRCTPQARASDRSTVMPPRVVPAPRSRLSPTTAGPHPYAPCSGKLFPERQRDAKGSGGSQIAVRATPVEISGDRHIRKYRLVSQIVGEEGDLIRLVRGRDGNAGLEP